MSTAPAGNPGRGRRTGRRIFGVLVLVGLLAVSGTILFGTPAEPPGSPPVSAQLESNEEIHLAEEEEANSFVPPRHHDSGGGSAQFMEPPGYDNSVQQFGTESSEPEFLEAAAALHGYLDAVAAGNWAAACGYVTQEVIDGYLDGAVPVDGEVSHGCAVAMWSHWSHGLSLTAQARADEADAGSLRVEGGKGYLIYHGLEGGRTEIGMARENGRWKLAGLEGLAF